MALTDDSNFTMPVAPMYGGGNGFGNNGDWAWIILLLLLGWGNNGFGNSGFGGGSADLYPWMNQSQNVNDGFRDQMLNTNITSIRDGISGISTQLCNGFAGVNAGVANGFAQSEISANARQMADMNQNFAMQTAMSNGFNALGSQFADCCCENRLGIADLKYTVATENCADRTASAQNTRDIIDAQTRGTQAILDKLCSLELDGVKAQLAQAERENLGLQNQLNMATVQNGLNNEVDALYNRLKNCPVGTYPVCNPTTPVGGGCGCGSF